MDFLKDILGDIDNKEDIIEKIKKELPKHYIPKHEFNNKNEELKSTKSKMDELQSKLSAMETSLGENETLKAQLNAISGEFENFKQQADLRVVDLQKKQSLEKALLKANANPDSVDLLMSQFDLSKIVLDAKGSIVDENLHIEPVKQSRPSLFAQTVIGGNTPPEGQTSDTNLVEQYNKMTKEGNMLGAAMLKRNAKLKGIII